MVKSVDSGRPLGGGGGVTTPSRNTPRGAACAQLFLILTVTLGQLLLTIFVVVAVIAFALMLVPPTYLVAFC